MKFSRALCFTALLVVAVIAIGEFFWGGTSKSVTFPVVSTTLPDRSSEAVDGLVRRKEGAFPNSLGDSAEREKSKRPPSLFRGGRDEEDWWDENQPGPEITPSPLVPAGGVTVGTPEPKTQNTPIGKFVGEPPEMEALREVESSAGDPEEKPILKGMTIGAGGTQGATTPSPSPSAERTPVPSLTPTPSPSLSRVSGQARGYALLYLMHPHARPAVDQQIEILKRANLEEVYISALTDGTFGIDYDYLNSVIRTLSEEGRRIILSLYLTNGPTMRVFDSTPITAGFNRIEPSEFRSLIQYDPSTRETFKQMARAALPSFELNLSLSVNNKNYAIVMLEDNLDRGSYRSMREIAAEVLGDKVTFMRNPCPRCWEGNDTDSLGDPVEYHAPTSTTNLKAGDGYTLDGKGFYFPNETDPRGQHSVDEVNELAAESELRGAAFFGLWRFQRQGLSEGKIHPDRRNYEVPTEAQAAVEIEMLRHGLKDASAQ